MSHRNEAVATVKATKWTWTNLMTAFVDEQRSSKNLENMDCEPLMENASLHKQMMNRKYWSLTERLKNSEFDRKRWMKFQKEAAMVDEMIHC
jgi:hypothetical protein